MGYKLNSGVLIRLPQNKYRESLENFIKVNSEIKIIIKYLIIELKSINIKLNDKSLKKFILKLLTQRLLF